MVLLLAAVAYGIFLWISVDARHPFQILTIMGPLILLSFYLLRQGRTEMSYAVTVLYLYIANYVGNDYGRDCMAAINGVVIILSLFFFLASSHQSFALTIVGCLFLDIKHMYTIKSLFATNLSKEQSDQIDIFNASAFIAFGCISLSFYCQKRMETNLWEMANTNYIKSEALTKEVLEASKAKDVFLSSLSHEIRNPLNLVKGCVEYLMDAVTDSNSLKMLRSANLGCEVLINLVNNVLDAAKLKSDKMEISFSETNLMDIIQKVLVINSEALRSKGIRAKITVEKDLPRIIWIDSSRLLQIMMNLVSNAIKFTPQGGQVRINVAWILLDTDKTSLLEKIHKSENDSRNIRPALSSESITSSPAVIKEECNMEDSLRIEESVNVLQGFKVRTLQSLNDIVHYYTQTEPWILQRTNLTKSDQQTSTSKGYLKVEVSDTGCGIAQENIAKLFTMFTQAHKSVSQMYGGTGLGLWICKQLCQKMQGDIKLYSEASVGTTVVFYISVDNDQITELPSRPALKHERVNVLIVDDYSHNRDLHQLLIEREGAIAILASSGEEAVAKFKAQKEDFFSFIMLDVLMPGIDGFATAKLIRDWEREQNRKNVDIYFVTGEYFNDEEILAAFTSTHRDGKATGIRCLRKTG